MNKREGFTLIELIVVMVLIGFFAVIVLPRYANLQTKAKVSESKAALGTIRSALMLNYSSNLAKGTYPFVPQSVYPSMFQDSQIPLEPQTNSDSITFITDPSQLAAGSGWAYDSLTGRAWINNSQYIDY